jgi:hypothetical protein
MTSDLTNDPSDRRETAGRIELLRREYVEGTPPDQAPEAASSTMDDDEPRIQTKLPF